MSSIFLAEDKTLISDEDRGELGALGCREQPHGANKTKAMNSQQARCLMVFLPDIIIRSILIMLKFSLFNLIEVATDVVS